MANGKNVDSFYLLMRDRTVKRVGKGYNSSNRKFISLLQGEILIRNVTSVTDERNGLIRLHPYGKPSYYCDCPFGEVKHIDEEQAKLLLPISTMRDRFNLFINKSLEHGKKMTLGCHVYVNVKPVGYSNKHELRGIVRYKGPLPNEYGTYFGVELLEGTGRGTTDGMYRGMRFFNCENDCGVFVSLERLRLCEDQTKTKSETKTDTKEVNGTDDNNSGVFTKVRKIAQDFSNFVLGEQPHENSLDMQKKISKCASHGGHKFLNVHHMGDRVWVYIDDKLCGGHIRYIGRLPAGKDILVGIELDHAYGQGNGVYYHKQLFTCKMNHAHFTPIDNVISKDKFQKLSKQPEGANVPGTTDLENKPLSQLQTSEDILNMESRFSNQSEDQIRKEQEMVLKKFQEDKQKMAETKDFQKNGVEHTELDEQWKNKNGNQPNTNRHVSCTAVDVNKHVKDPRNPTSLPSKLDIGSMVQVTSKHQTPKYGIIRWIGFLPNRDKKVAGLELEEELNACTDGTFLGKRYFTCPNRRGFFVHLHNCEPDSRFDTNSFTSLETFQLCEDQTETKSESRTDAKDINGTDDSDLEKNPPSQPQTLDDILNMESRFSNQSEDQIRKEQENMLKKFQEDKQKMATTQDLQEDGSKKSAEHALYAGRLVNDRVWVYLGNKLCGGYVKYIGRIPAEKEVLVGVELLVTEEDFQKYVEHSLATAESQEEDSGLS